jgi:hypothetical protein
MPRFSSLRPGPGRIEVRVTRDEAVDCRDGSWEIRSRRPADPGWRLTDSLSSDKRSLWTRSPPLPAAGRAAP